MGKVFFIFAFCLSFVTSGFCNLNQKTVLVCGAGGFIGHHLVKRYKQEGYWVRGVDIKFPEFALTEADEFVISDLRLIEGVNQAFEGMSEPFDEVCQLAANMGGMGFICAHDAEIMHDSMLININVLEKSRLTGVGKIFYSSSACVYPEYNQNSLEDPCCSENSVYPAMPDTEYGWEKLFSERLYQAYARTYGLDVRIARLHNIFGEQGTWKGGREKAPAALCRKIAETENLGTIEVWGDGKQTRSFLYIEECIEGIRKIMSLEKLTTPLNVGSEEIISINDLTQLIADIANKKIHIKNVPGPQGVRGRNSDNALIKDKCNWAPSMELKSGIEKLYFWVLSQVENKN